jgi:hypothetical protein
MLVALMALFVALGGTSIAAVSLKRNSVKNRHIAKNAVTAPKVKNASLLAQDFAPGQLPAGPEGRQGPRGENATKLFGYIRDGPGGSGADTANVEYGSGVTAVTEGMTNGSYTVTFAQSLQNCVVHAIVGRGNPPGNLSVLGIAASARVDMAATANPQEVKVDLESGDTSFLITAFC